jgi:pilus assembly protein CpaF
VHEIEKLKPLLQDERVTDILITSGSKTQVEVSGKLTEVESLFEDGSELRAWVQALFSSWGGRLDLSQPLGEVSVPTDFGLLRIHAVLAGECSFDTQVSIRRHSLRSLSLQELLASNSINLNQLQLMQSILLNKENFVIVGGTGAGKTTLLRAMLNEVSGERIVTLEENFELALAGIAVALKTRESNHEGVGAITLTTLLRNALRMRPDRIVIGEARGEELLLLLQSLNTGHTGAGFSLHANSYKDAYLRMVGILNFAGVSNNLAKALIANSIHWVIEVRREDGLRRVMAIERLNVEL